MESRVKLNRRKAKEERQELKAKKRLRLKKKFKIIIFFIIFLCIGTILYARFCEPFRLEVKEYKVDVSSNITDNYNGLKIVHFSDLHYESTILEDELNKIIDTINNLNPDLVVFTGDLVDEDISLDEKETASLIKELSRIDSNLGKYAIYGNHDLNISRFDNIMKNSDFMILNNSYDLIYNQDNNPILIFGFDDMINGSPSYDTLLDESLVDIPYKIVLVHEPDYIDEFKNAIGANLVLSGHSHGGQVKLPLIRPLFLPIGCKEYYDDYYEVNEIKLYISSGLGTSILKLRLNNIPSINLYRLNKIK
ncbi:MAG TPA: metallophosphoesterase [Bacilli bacterium]|nr:metallophosphoesterase [Bacilli bacterium]